MLDEQEFVEVRTNRNQYKITPEEQATLSVKKIGIIGLSVGQSIALTLAMERGFGELRLADFDELDLSNLNRIRTAVYNIGVPKVYVAAREIAEIDPFLKVVCYPDGLTEDNMDDFMTGNGKLDLLVDECDGLDMKILARYKARSLQIPVMMDTSDRGMLDIERFDLEPDRPILHGLVGDLDPKGLSSLSNEDKIPIVLQIAGATEISNRGKASMIEVGQSISTWPQLASSVVLGGAVAADVSRRLLLGSFTDSGRYYIDLDELVANKAKATRPSVFRDNPYKTLDAETVSKLVQALPENLRDTGEPHPDQQTIHAIIHAGILAPSTGNDQPWKWHYENGIIYLLHEQQRSFSFGDYKNIASYLTFGAVQENLVLEAQHKGWEVETTLYPLGEDQPLVAAFQLRKTKTNHTEEHLHNDFVTYIHERCTNRNMSPRQEIPAETLEALQTAAESVPGAQVTWLTDGEHINQAGAIIGACDRIRLLHEEGHNDFVNREMRWTTEEAESTKDGIDVLTLGLSTAQLSALQIIKDYKVIDFVKEVKGGGLFEMATKRAIATASAIGLITMPEISTENYMKGGRAMERLWLASEKFGVALHPVISPLYIFPRILQGNGEALTAADITILKRLRTDFVTLFDIRGDLAEVFLFKLAYAPKPAIKSLRMPVADVLL